MKSDLISLRERLRLKGKLWGNARFRYGRDRPTTLRRDFKQCCGRLGNVWMSGISAVEILDKLKWKSRHQIPPDAPLLLLKEILENHIH